MNAKQQREWEDDVTQPCAFPEPLAEVLTRENRELRAEVERLRECVNGQKEFMREGPFSPKTSLGRHANALWHEAHKQTAIAADATTAAQNLRDELQGAQERLRRVEALRPTGEREWRSADGVRAGSCATVDWLDLSAALAPPASPTAAVHEMVIEMGVRPWCEADGKPWPCPTISALGVSHSEGVVIDVDMKGLNGDAL